jgi:nanoRNase/pAp phosphatase (c-di-AMP/oligoRNAs hydrolase)
MDISVPYSTISRLVASSNDALVIVSRPVDPDCIGTALALRWLLAVRNQKASIVSFFAIPSNMTGFPGIEEVTVAEAISFDFSPFDLIITVDGSSWGQFLDDAWEKVLSRIDLKRIVSIDHHEPEEIMRAIPDRCLNIKTSSTAQVLYDYFIEPSQLRPPAHIADCLYQALLYDTRGFRNEAHTGAYRFAETLIALGADHARAVDVNYDMREVQYLTWAIEHTEFINSLGLMLLVIDAKRIEKLEAMLGKDCLDFDTIYKEIIQRQVAGFHYGVMLTDKLNGTVRLNWRTRGYGSHCAIGDIARQAGFKAGGHRNAGGGVFTGSIESAKARLLEKLRQALHA